MLFIRGRSLRGKTALLLTHDFEPVIDAIYNHADFFQGLPKASFLENINGNLFETEIIKEDILSSVQVASDNVTHLPNAISKLIYLRRLIEIIDGKTPAWQLLSNLFHKREIPMIGEVEMSAEEKADADQKIREYIPDFDYQVLYPLVIDEAEMIARYHDAGSNYEKLQIYRILFNPTEEDHVLRKFLNETYHTENDYLFS